MLLIACPHCGDRSELEFRNCGEAGIARLTGAVDDATFADFLYVRSNPRGLLAERWRHVHGCGRFFVARRHTVTDRFEP